MVNGTAVIFWHGELLVCSPGKKRSSNWFGDLILLVIIGVVIYALYRTCIAPSVNMGTAESFDSGSGGAQGHPRGPPPPYGFREDYMPGSK